MSKKGTVAFILMLLLTSTITYSQIKFSGDARFRPRLDIDDKTEAGQTYKSDFYYLYRIRLNMKADIGEGYFLSTKIAHNGIAYYGKATAGLSADAFGAYGTDYRENGKRMSVDFMELYGGRNTEIYGYKFGLFEVGSFNNPIYDIHYMPTLMVDIPFFTFNVDGLFGASAYYVSSSGKLTFAAFIDDALGNTTEDKNGNVINSNQDQYSFYTDYELKIGDWKAQPIAMITIADSAAAPITFGGIITFPKVADLTFSGSIFYSNSSKKASEINSADFGMPANQYNAWKARLKVTGKLGPAYLTWFVELANLTNKFEASPDTKTDFLYSWLSYKFVVFKGEYGEFSIAPQWRFIKYDSEIVNLRTRNLFEVDVDFKF